MKSKLTLASAAVMAVMIVIAILLLTYVIKAPDSGNDVITVTVENGGEEWLSFENLSLLPGESCAYTVSLLSGYADGYDVDLTFVAGEETALGSNVYVRVVTEDGRTLCDASLTELFDGGTLIFSCALSGGEGYDLTVTYYMPPEVGNEAKNAEVIFDLRITASNE